MLFGMQTKIVLIMIAVVGVILTGFYFYYQDTQKRLQILNENNAKLETAVEIVEESNRIMEESFTRQQELQRQTTRKFQEIEQTLDGLDETLRKHDLQFLALKKPGLIENRINKATKKMFDQLEQDTTQ